MGHYSKSYTAILKLMMGAACIALAISGCSSDYSPISGSGSDETPPATFQYPPLTEETLANGPVPGFKFFSPNAAGALDDYNCDSASVSRQCSPNQGRTLRVSSLVEVVIARGDVASTTVFTAVAPMSCVAVVDCYPHPYQFEDQVEIRWLLNEMDLPPDFDYSTLVPWYINDAGEYVPVEHDWEWQGNHETLVLRTNHFSRYIIGERTL